jgi:hypothetical protein
MGKNRKVENIDWTTIVIMINRAIQETMINTLAYKQWSYYKTCVVSHGTSIPRDFIRQIRCLVSKTGHPPFNEARHVQAEEFNNLHYWKKNVYWNSSSPSNPIYSFWGDNLQQFIMISPNTTYQTGTCPDGYVYNLHDMSGILEYYYMPADLVNNDGAVEIPFEYWELLILGVMRRIYLYQSEPIMIAAIQKETQAYSVNLENRFLGLRTSEKRVLDNFTEEVIPYKSFKPFKRS